MSLLEVKNLKTIFYTEKGIVPAVNDVSFKLEKGDTLGIVGESGCGKSVTALSILRLLAKPAGKIESGEILFNGKNILDLSEDEMRTIRGNEISMIFQEPMTSLNPVYTVGDQLSEVFQLHHGSNPKEAMERSIEALKMVGIPSPERRVTEFPHALSGGMRQRAMIAMALACEAKVLICDEPTTALDVTIQAQVLDLMSKLQEELGMAMIFISHDLGVIAELSDKVLVMYAGKVVEEASTEEIFHHPKHPYTQALLQSIPKLGSRGQQKLYSIPGIVPNLLKLPKGCTFADRCSKAKAKCRETIPALEGQKDSKCPRRVRCYFPSEEPTGEPKK